jgi:hypothetical protein
VSTNQIEIGKQWPYVPGIPASDLFMIEEVVRDRIDDMIFQLHAKHTWQAEPQVQQILSYMKLRQPALRKDLIVHYLATNKKLASDSFSLSRVVETAVQLGATGMYVGKLAIRLFAKDGIQADEIRVFFENVAPQGKIATLAKGMRRNYLRKHGLATMPPGERNRILRFSDVRSRDNHHLDPAIVNTPEFMKLLTQKTYGLVIRLEEEEVNRVGFAGRDYHLGNDSVWKHFLE